MELRRLQDVLARLYTDAELRGRFVKSPQETAAELGITPEEATALADSTAAELDQFGTSLIRKRLTAMRKNLPLTAKTAGKQIDEWFFEYAEAGRSSFRDYRTDAVAFASFIVKKLKIAATRHLSLLRELVRYESVWLETADGRPFIRIAYFPIPVRRVAAAVQRDELTPGSADDGKAAFTLPGGPVIAFWLRFTRHGKVIHGTVPWVI